MIEASKRLPAWRTAIVEAAYEQASLTDQLDGALILHANFFLKPPKLLRRLHPTTPPDLDKLVRALCDGLQIGGLIINDSQITRIHASKSYNADWQGVYVTLQPEED